MKHLLKKNLVYAALLIFSAAGFAQSVGYKVLENEPGKRNLIVFLNPFYINTYASDINLGYELQATYMLANKLTAQAVFRKAYLDENATSIFAPKGLTKAYEFEAGGIFNFSSKVKDVSNKVILMSISTGRYTYSESIRVRADARRTAGFRGGMVGFHNNYKIGNDITAAFAKDDIKAKDDHGKLVYVRDSVGFETVTYTGNSIGLYGGIDLRTIRDILIDADGYGEKSNRTTNNFYLDAFFTPAVVYAIKPNSGQAYLAKADINISENSRKYFGWRFGWHYIINKSFGFNAKMELGQQPGRPVKSFYFNLGFGFNIGFKAKAF